MEEDEAQKEILRKLEEYSESFLDKPLTKRKKRKLRSESCTEQHESIKVDTISRRQKKKLKRKSMNGTKEGLDIIMSKKKKIKSEKKQLKLLKMELDQMGGESGRTNTGKTESGTRDVLPVKQRKEPEVVVFNSKRKRNNEGELVDNSKASNAESGEDLSAPVFDMKMARLDVQKFGIKGFEGLKKEEAMTSLLVKLGAKAPKNKFLNYKDYQDKVKKESEEKRNKKDLDRKLGFKVRSSNKKDRVKVKNKNDVGEVAGQVGSFKNGVLFLKKKDLVGMNKSKSRK